MLVFRRDIDPGAASIWSTLFYTCTCVWQFPSHFPHPHQQTDCCLSLSGDKEMSKLHRSLASIGAGAFAGTCFWLSCYPIDVIKGRMQAAPLDPPLYKGMVHCARTLHAKEGLPAFFRGFTPCLVRSLPANAAAFFAFDLAMQYLPE